MNKEHHFILPKFFNLFLGPITAAKMEDVQLLDLFMAAIS